jgi:HK97 gp10 family phage protein
MKIEGIETVLQRIENIVDTASIKQAMGDCCALVEGTVKTTARKGTTGDLRNSIQSKVKNDGFNVIGVIYTPLEYAPYVEYGTGLFAENGNGRKEVPWHYKDEKGKWHSTNGQKPQPFLRPALADNSEKITKILKESVKW